ncbi:lipid A biosynthesis acyltransferase [Prolixibacteraceae bacterium JC049]|nr:lipid A biosynthesis acyltransferase [Prolixibacteraceae bacterium JC049]
MDKILYYILKGATKLMHFVPIQVHYFFSDILFFLMCHVMKYRKKVIVTNIRNSFPEKSDAEVKQIMRKFYAHFCDMVFETLYFAHISKKEILKRLEVRGVDQVNQLTDSGRNVVLVMAHYGNWEWMSAAPADVNAPYYHFYKPLRSKAWDRFMLESRSRWGGLLTDKKDVYRSLMGMHRQNKVTVSGFVGDQTPKANEIQYWTNFMNQDTPVLLGAEKIAKKLDAPIFFIHMNRKKRGYYEVDTIPLIMEPKDEEPFAITEKHVRFLEEIIRRRPELWLWSHKRWKHKREA